MARRSGKGARGKRRLSTAKKGRGRHGGRWKHGFKPLNATARAIKAKKYRVKGKRRKSRKSR